MKAITLEPRKPGSARLEDVPEPDARDGSILVEAIAVGVCGTDVEMVEGQYGWAPPGKSRLVLGHESLGRVIDPGPSNQLKRGDLVVGIVRRPDPVPCPNCAVGEWDMCRNGQYTERGIKEIDGFMSERWRTEPEFTIKVDPSLGLLGVLLEPATVVTKALEHVAEIGRRSLWEPRTVLVTGAGPIGLLAALIAKQHGKEVHVLDRMESGPKPDVVRALGATYHSGSVTALGFEPDAIIECTGVGQVIAESIQTIGASGIVCLTGVGHGGIVTAAACADIAAAAVLKNNVIVGSVNANKRHWYKAGEFWLAPTARGWRDSLAAVFRPKTSGAPCTETLTTSRSSCNSRRPEMICTLWCSRWSAAACTTDRRNGASHESDYRWRRRRWRVVCSAPAPFGRKGRDPDGGAGTICLVRKLRAALPRRRRD